MTHVATLIADPATPCIEARHLRQAAELLPAPAPPHWLASGVAVDLSFAPLAGEDNQGYANLLRAALRPAPIDVVVQSVEGRRKKLLVADLDSTLIQQESLDELADLVGLREAVAAVTERSMCGEIDFASALRDRVALLRGLPIESALRQMRARLTLTPGGPTLVRTMRRSGATVAIVSGGFTQVTAFVAETLGIDIHFANRLVVADGALTGGLEEPILDREAKARILAELRAAKALSRYDTLAVGDGANDLAMLAEAGLGVAFRGKPAVASVARARIDHGDLTALLYLQGYAVEEFARG